MASQAVRLSTSSCKVVSLNARSTTSARAPVKVAAIQKRAANLSASTALQGNPLAGIGFSTSTVTPRAQSLKVLAGPSGGRGRRGRRDEPEDGFEERVVQVRRVTKVVKGGKQMSFRAVVVAGNGEGTVGVGCAKAKEVINAVQKASIEAKKAAVTVSLANRAKTLSHRAQCQAGGAVVMLRPASEGTGVIAGGAVRVVLELAGVKNCFGKQLGSPNALNNARATVLGLQSVRSFNEVAADRNTTVEELFA